MSEIPGLRTRSALYKRPREPTSADEATSLLIKCELMPSSTKIHILSVVALPNGTFIGQSSGILPDLESSECISASVKIVTRRVLARTSLPLRIEWIAFPGWELD